MNLRRIGMMAGLSALLAAAPAARAADIEPGLYLRTSYAFGNLSLNTILVGPGHRIAFDPRGGVDPFDFQAAARQSPATVGTFAVEGNKIIVTWAGGKVERLDVEFESGKLSAYDGGLVSKAEAYRRGQTMNATFAGIGQTRNVSGSLTLALTADGRFTRTGGGGIFGTPGDTGASEETVQGTYQLFGNSLVLTSNGRVTRHTVLPFNTALDPRQAKPSDEHMILDNANLHRER